MVVQSPQALTLFKIKVSVPPVLAESLCAMILHQVGTILPIFWVRRLRWGDHSHTEQMSMLQATTPFPVVTSGQVDCRVYLPIVQPSKCRAGNFISRFPQCHTCYHPRFVVRGSGPSDLQLRALMEPTQAACPQQWQEAWQETLLSEHV